MKFPPCWGYGYFLELHCDKMAPQVNVRHGCLKGLTLIIEGFRAKRAYIGFWPIFIFLQDQANFSQTDLF